MNGDKALFPLFTKPNGSSEASEAQPVGKGPTEISGVDGAQDEDVESTKAAKARKTRRKQIPGQKTLQEIVNPQAASNGREGDAGSVKSEGEIDVQERSPRRSKRRRTSRTDSVEVGGEDVEDASNTTPQRRPGSPQVIIPASSPPITESKPTASNEKTKTPPKKMLRLKAGGKFSSPVSRKENDEDALPVETAKKRGRPRKSKEPEQDKHLIAVIKYDAEKQLGARIDRTLAGEERFKKQVKIVPKKQSTPHKANAQSAHPFFSLDRRKEQAAPKVLPSPRKTSAVTPGKLRRETLNADHERQANEVPEVWTSSLLKDRLMFKHPGAKDSAWPDRQQAHVRGLTSSELADKHVDAYNHVLPRRKRKAAQRSLSPSESLLTRFASNLVAEQDGNMMSDGFREPHPSLRLPSKSLTSGQEIAHKVAAQLSLSLTDPELDELSITSASQQSMHPALQSAYGKICKVLSTFDEGRGETATWSQKYAPLSCDEVLQPARQTTVLKDWLSSLKVTAVEAASRSELKPAAKADAKTKKRKKRRKDDDLNDFLVDSDEEIHNMDELTDPEDIPAPSQGRKALNSIVQIATEGAKLSNAVLLSGPHGCGKSAAAYAAAKQLAFRVFEINSSERRSGKDVLDKVGDMTENHLVKHHGTDSGEQSSTEEPNARLDDAFQRDLASGRQGTMAGFFKPKVKAKPKPKSLSPKKAVKAKAVEAVQNVLKKPSKDQQQSLILLEEVDILFKEDKDFWITVLKLITTSKRPFIMTCNDEDLVPLQAMSLHAILRFTPPPVDLATDYLLLIAAAEGHLLQRNAISSLYRSKGCDLRAAISELDLWCQMGVGDPRGGLSWIFQRYPPGSDLDSQGRRLRVVSDGTYQSGMDICVERTSGFEEKLISAWREHGIDACDALGWHALRAEDVTVDVKNFSRFADDLSAVETYAGALCAAHLDITQKPMKDKARSHYIEGLPLLQADEQADYSGLSLELLTTSTVFTFKDRTALSSDAPEATVDGIGSIEHNDERPPSLTRHAFACFDAISVPVESTLSTVSGLQQSAFDGPLQPIATDIAPYVRSIVHFDLALAEQRDALGGGNNTKRARTTRAARSALEGGQRASTRRERWFPKQLDYEAVLETGGKEWPRVLAVAGEDGASGEEGEEGDVPASSAESQ